MDSEKILVHLVSEKFKTLVYSSNALRFVDKNIASLEDFEKTWEKKLTTAIKMEIPLDSILQIFKNSDSEGYFVKTNGRYFSKYHIQFIKKEDQENFINFLKTNLKFTYSEEPLSNKKDILLSIFYLFLILVFTYFMYSMACKETMGELVDPVGYSKTDRNNRFFNFIVRFLGKPGILILGIGGFIYTFYKNFVEQKPEKKKIIYSPNLY